ncbi:TetR/AcrR family transcriptional regulator [Tsukamurella strandjordii]|uniref:TetR/AcrR family transcriptional regulator n=1 Tax=Tsukamurella strandjordii TaxID=147577 RepID=A0AA90SFQ2_9ACTN|nr:TetR/AcrR family transcriptional regulator [Tsukamurella strandjordii]MDP0396834.1 TetR/AcrR family transcriptional regulator [Tsukamurella strandjordii]
MDSLEQRQHARRRTMLDTGVALLGGPDGGAVSVRAVCRTTGITERYFYEAFGNRDEFVRAVYDDVSARAQEVLVDAVRGTPETKDVAAAAVAAFVDLVVDRPDLGRVLLLAPYRESALAEYGLGHMPGFFAVVGAALPPQVDEQSRRLASVGMVGAMTALFTEYLSGRLEIERDDLVRFCATMLRSYLMPPIDRP